MANGEGCKCHSYSESECAYGVDWTPQEFYDLLRVAEQLQFWARRYANKRMTYCVEDVNSLTAKLIDLGGQPKADLDERDREFKTTGTVWANDGNFDGAVKPYVEKYGRDGKGAGPAIQPKGEGCGYSD